MRQPPKRLGRPEHKPKMLHHRRDQIADMARGPVYVAIQKGRAERFFAGWIRLWWGT